MFEDMTFAALLDAGKRQVSDDVLKSEASLVYNAIAALAYELKVIYSGRLDHETGGSSQSRL